MIKWKLEDVNDDPNSEMWIRDVKKERSVFVLGNALQLDGENKYRLKHDLVR
jgi:hypothetical protein